MLRGLPEFRIIRLLNKAGNFFPLKTITYITSTNRLGVVLSTMNLFKNNDLAIFSLALRLLRTIFRSNRALGRKSRTFNIGLGVHS